MNLTDLFDIALDHKASDIHLASGDTPCLRMSGELTRLPMPSPTRDQLLDFLEPMLGVEGRGRLAAGEPVEKTLMHGDLAFIGIAFGCGNDEVGASFRVLRHGVPSLEVTGVGAMPLMRRIVDMARHDKGLVLMVGPTGSGKWTIACSLIDAINDEKSARIFVIERHPNYRFESKLGLVSQIRIGRDCPTYERACDLAFLADLDVVAVDDIPTVETLRQLLILADTGHLVIANLHAEDAVDAVQRLLDTAGTEAHALRRSLAANLTLVTGQRLLRRANDSGRVAAYEWLATSPAVRNALLSGDMAALRTLQSTEATSRSAAAALADLVAEGLVSSETA